MVSEESLADSHKERIYRALESEIRAQEPGLLLVFNGILDWGWIDQDYCLFVNPNSMAASFIRPESPLARYIQDFGNRHEITTKFRAVDPERFGSHSPYRRAIER